jgi:quinol monooxygenase YgiN
MSKFGMYVKFTTQAGHRDDLVAVLLEAASAMKDLAGCELYIVNISDTEADSVWVTEVWSDSNSHQASLTTEASKALIERGKPLILGVQQTKLTPVGGKGLA